MCFSITVAHVATAFATLVRLICALYRHAAGRHLFVSATTASLMRSHPKHPPFFLSLVVITKTYVRNNNKHRYFILCIYSIYIFLYRFLTFIDFFFAGILYTINNNSFINYFRPFNIYITLNNNKKYKKNNTF